MNLFKPKNVAYANCDLPCGVYDTAQARINAESVVNASKKYQESDDPAFKQRCITIKEDMAEEVKKDLWVLWTDYFKPEHLEKGIKWIIRGKERPEISIKLYKQKPDFAEFKKQMKRVAGHEFGK